MVFSGMALLLQDSASVTARVWTYLTQTFTFGRITVSVSSVLIGMLVLTATIVFARYLSTFIEGRLQLRSHIDPGLRYTICRLVRYFVVIIGTLVSIKQAFAVDLT